MSDLWNPASSSLKTAVDGLTTIGKAKALPAVTEVVQKLTLPEGLEKILDVTKLPDFAKDVPSEFYPAVQSFSKSFTVSVESALRTVTKENFIQQFSKIMDEVQRIYGEFRSTMEAAADGSVSLANLPAKLEGLCQMKLT